MSAEAFAVGSAGAASTRPSIGEGSSVRPGSKSGAKAQDGSPGNLGGPVHVHVRANRQIGSPVEQGPRPGRHLRPCGSASSETRSEEDRVEPGSEANKRPDRRDGKS